MTYNRILIINLGGIGDMLLSTPAIRALSILYPNAEIDMLVSSRAYEIVNDLSYIDEVFTLDIKYGGKIPFVKVSKNLRTLLALRKKQFDLAVNMRTLASKGSAKKAKLLLDIIKPKVKAGRDTEGRGHFFDIKIPETDIGKKYEMDYDIDTVKVLGAEVVDKSIDFEIDQENIEKVGKILEKEGISKDDILVGIHPGGMPSRRWPLENFSKVIDDIHKNMPCVFAITGGKDEVGLANKIMKNKNIKIINLAGKLSIKQLGALIKRCSFYITNDTGPMHIAAILRMPLLAIFGPGDITRFDPRNISDKAIVLYKRIECAPCNRVTCNSMKCLKAILPGGVVVAAFKLLNLKRSK